MTARTRAVENSSKNDSVIGGCYSLSKETYAA